ncbi:hypothetical protein L1987_29952 [Smallanthus sonchifolius]|uniref:Uncharacterized protein n=1 Tax=Smallanthus sonchifolius TaxID=185202 RepID=A0ACB9I2X4_9ASTR|nr:hypothetical protein L1987_29952 [Smallanthus sonchifolius]
MASTRLNNIEASAEQLCYVPCNFCNFVLAVGVPCNKLFDNDIVKVRCGHCTNLLPVNMGMVAGFYHCHPNSTSQDSSSSRLDDQLLKNTSTNSTVDLGLSSKYISMNDPKTVLGTFSTYSDAGDGQ